MAAVTTVQTCAADGCDDPAAFRTRTKPAWCDAHVTAQLAAGSLEPLEPFTKPTAWRLTRCLSCGCVAHYRLVYTLEKNAEGEATCRACYWRSWAGWSYDLQGAWADLTPVPEAEARAHADANGFDYLEPLTSPSLRNHPHRVQCRYCDRISAHRLGDIGFGCSCQANPSRAAQTARPAGRKQPADLFKDSAGACVSWWDHDRNDPASFATATIRARREAHWICPDCGNRFTERICDITVAGCPECTTRRRARAQAERDRLEGVTVADVPELLAAWADDSDPATVPVLGIAPIRRFVCPLGHHPRLTPYRFWTGGCPSCRGNQTRTERSALTTIEADGSTMSPEVASQWHPTRNRGLDPVTISPASSRLVWWRDPVCEHEWEATPGSRGYGARLRCPICRTILDSLAYHDPDTAAEWSSANPKSAWQVRPTAQLPFLPAWVCAIDPTHTWEQTLGSRAAGAGCPQCAQHGKSRVELDHYAAAVEAFGAAASGLLVRSEAFGTRSGWRVDIAVDLPDSRQVAVEYDGAYWHAGKTDVDTEKSADLLAAGWRVVRLREHPLPPLPLTDAGYLEIVVYSQAPDPAGNMARIHDWLVSEPDQR